jgi:hypothetical protein
MISIQSAGQIPHEINLLSSVQDALSVHPGGGDGDG